MYWFTNGALNGTQTYSTSIGSNTINVYVGTTGSGTGDPVNGYISNLRVVKGTAVYTAAFNPPSGQLQAITNTSLLTCAYSTFRDGSTNNFTITVNGNTAVSTQNPFPLTTLPNPALGNQGNGVYSMSQYQSLLSQNLWPAVDPYWRYVTLMLHGNGTNGAQNNTFLDSSTNNFTITRNGNTSQGTFAPYGNNWGNYFDGSGDWLDVASNAAFGYGTGDFTIEFWVFPTSATGTQVYLDQRAGSATSAAPTIYTISGTIYYYVSGNNRITGGTVTTNQWSHIALCRSGTSTKLFINGVQTGSTYTDSTTYVTAPVRIGDGNDGAGPYPYPGYVSNFRIVKGTALYTAAFTPPTAPLTAITNTSLLTCQSNRFIDNSTNAFTITRNGDVSVQRFSPFNPTAPYAAGTDGGSGYFDGTGDYLTSTTSSALDLSTGDWTIQGWFYPTAYSAGNNVLAYVGASSGDKIVIANIATGGNGLWYLLNGTGVITSSTSAPLNAWSFFALVKSGSTTTLYLNGVSLGTTTSVPTSSNKSVNIGSDAGGAPYQGYFGDIRILKGTANTAVPTAPLTAITNTSLLLNFTNAGILDNAEMNNLETVGNAQISTAQSKFGGASMYFDGTGDSLFVPSTSRATNFGTGNFTIEFWFYTNSTSWSIPFDSREVGSANNPAIQWSPSGYTSKITAYLDDNFRIASGTLSTSTWYHIALVRSGTTATLYIDGVSAGTYTYSTSVTNTPLFIGNFYAGGYSVNGYIDDLRITKGYARYTSTFTPQRSQWQDQ